MTSKYKVVFREEYGANGGSLHKWQLGCPLFLSAVQISRDTETAEAYLQVKALNISETMVNEVRAEAIVQYPDGSSETLTLVDLDADVQAGAAYVFRAAALARGDAERADVRIVRAKLSGGGFWESEGESVDIVLGEPLELSDERASARASYLKNKGCVDAASATRKIGDRGDYWTCSCGQVNLAKKCATCKIGKQEALKSESSEFLDELIDKRRQASSKAEEEKQQRKKRTKLVVAVVAAAVAAIAIFSQMPQPDDSAVRGSGHGAYVVSKAYYYDDNGQVESVTEYELGEHGDVLVVRFGKGFDITTYSYKYDSYGNVIQRKAGELSFKRIVDETDSYGQPTRITETDRDGDKTIYEIEWYGEGRVASVVEKYVDYDYEIIRTFGEEGEMSLWSMTYYLATGPRTYLGFYGYEYDSEGRVISMIQRDEDWKIESETEYEYDENGNKIKLKQDGKTVVEYEYVYIEDASPSVVMMGNHFSEPF